jgi:hypothetical protein
MSDEEGDKMSSQEADDPEVDSENDSEEEEEGSGALVFPASYSTALAQLLQVDIPSSRHCPTKFSAV